MSGAGPDGEVRWAVVLADAGAARAAPPGIDGRAFALALCEDVVELVGDLSIVSTAVLTVPRGDADWTRDVTALCWPGTPVAEAPAGGTGSTGGAVLAALELASGLGASAAVVVAGDAPDLPGLLLGKVFRALGSAELAVSVTDTGELVSLASRLSAPSWLATAAASLDADGSGASPYDLLLMAGGDHLAMGPGWHRMRVPGDVRRLDPGLEGWSSTRALLSAPAR